MSRHVVFQSLQVPLDDGARSELASGMSVFEPVGQRRNSDDEPEKHVDKVDPDGMLHATDITVALGVFVDVHLCRLSVSL